MTMSLIEGLLITIYTFQLAEFSIESSANNSCGPKSSCPSWSYCDGNGTCQCYDWNFAVLCSEKGDEGGILQCHCLTLNHDTNETEEGNCLYNCNIYKRDYFRLNRVYTTLPKNLKDLNTQMCGRFNRIGTLCSKCQEGMYLRAYSYDMSCTTCSGGWINILKYIVIAFVPLTIFYILVLLFNINIPSSKLQGIVLVSQMATSPWLLRVFVIELMSEKPSFTFSCLQIFGTVFGIWNLDFFRLLELDICFKIAPLTVLSLDFLVGLYPFILILGTYLIATLYNNNIKLVHIICKGPIYLATKCYRKNFDIKSSTLDAFITFVLLSYVKLYNVCLDVLVPVTVHNMGHNTRLALFMDTSIPFFGHTHLSYALPALIVCSVFIIGPVILLFLYPFTFFQKFLNLFPYRWQIIIRVIVDSVQGCYGDGTEPGTRDCRWFSAFPFFLRFLFFAMVSYSFDTSLLPYFTQAIILAVIITIVLDPFKKIFKQMTSDFSMCLIFLATLYTLIIGMNYSFISVHLPRGLKLSVIFALTPCIVIIYITFHIIKWIIAHKKC